MKFVKKNLNIVLLILVICASCIGFYLTIESTRFADSFLSKENSSDAQIIDSYLVSIITFLVTIGFSIFYYFKSSRITFVIFNILAIYRILPYLFWILKSGLDTQFLHLIEFLLWLLILFLLWSNRKIDQRKDKD